MAFRNAQDEKGLTALAHRAQQGCRVSFARLVDRLGGRLLRFFEMKTRHRADAEDLVQETFLKAYQHLDRYDAARPFSTWLFAIAFREAVDLHRQKVRRRETPVTTQQATTAGPLEKIIQREEQLNLWRTAQNLPEKQHDALWLFYMEQMSVRDIAEVMKINHLHVRVLLYRARTNLAQQLKAASVTVNSAKLRRRTNSDDAFLFEMESCSRREKLSSHEVNV
ncbi:MAG: sigma-70 family RNA polymerase sigma factor [Sedimentisphaerales bacterium]|nr:sigma-70 family RNA polymerase sigma factor [Sedimentisphaerales bacterium]